MLPVLFKLGGVNVYSYGVCLIIAIITGLIVFSKQAKNKGLPMQAIPAVILISFFSFYFGSKIFYLLEEVIYYKNLTSFKYIFSSSGFSFAGGLTFLFCLIFVFAKVTKIPVLKIFDSITLPLTFIYIIGRLGCHLSGDGDYGTVIYPDSFWYFLGVSYENGTLPTPPGVVVHPVAIYEIIIYLFFSWFIWKKSKKDETDGRLFAFYLILTGMERFLIEFLYLNPKSYLGFSQPQIFSLILLVWGIILIRKTKPENNAAFSS